MIDWLGKLLGIEGLSRVAEFDVQYAAWWAQGRPVLVFFCCLAAAAVSAVFYVKYQTLRGRKARMGMAIFRAVVLALLVWILARPEAAMKVRQSPRPLLVLLFDGTDSMNMPEALPRESRDALTAALGPDAIADFGLPISDSLPENGIRNPKSEIRNEQGPTRQQLVRAAVRSEKVNWLKALGAKFRLRGYVMDQPDQVWELEMAQGPDGRVDTAKVAAQLDRCAGKVTAIGAALDDLRLRSRSHLLAGVVLVSDFDQNRGQPALHAAERLKAPIHTVGVGPTRATDLSVSLQAPMVLKKGETAGVTVDLRQTGLDGRDVEIVLLQRRMGTIDGTTEGERFAQAARAVTVRLDGKNVTKTLTYEPQETGRFTLEARVQPFGDEVRQANNADQREVTIRDESLKLLFVEFEPTWEWRFMKEVFHRDPMIGREGFRTYLDSADFAVRQGNDLFVQAIDRSREEFFSYDVIFLSDIPARMLSTEFQEMLHEYVSTFGGGLVVLGGSRYGPGALVDTKVADMLPVVIDPALRRRNGRFNLRLSPRAGEYDFMTLAENDYENMQAWSNLRELQWYQPSLGKHPLATVLADHPSDRCRDGKTPQPLIAIRPYGKGEVVYFAFNETWRLRKLYGEKYYARLWGQLIYRMGLSRALGSQKRFRVETDRPKYQAGEKVQITVEAYDRSYKPLELEGNFLAARLIAQQGPGGSKTLQTDLKVPLSRDKVTFETSVPVFAAGLYRLMVKDPITMKEVEVTFEVSPTTAERRSAVRNVAMQRSLAEHTGGRTYELHEIGTMAEQLENTPVEELSDRRVQLWNTWLVLVAGLVLMLGEWATRKLLNLQ